MFRKRRRILFKTTLKQHKKELASGLIFGYALTLFRSPDRILMAIIMYEPMITPIEAKSIMLNMFSPFLLVCR